MTPRIFVSSTWNSDHYEALQSAIHDTFFSENLLPEEEHNPHIVPSSFPFHALVATDLIDSYVKFTNNERSDRSVPTVLDQLEDVLESFLTFAHRFGVKRVRYYHFSEDDDDSRLVSAGSAGHNYDVAQQLRIGRIVQFKSSSLLGHAESFWAFAVAAPVLFEVCDSATQPLNPTKLPSDIPLLRIKRDSEDCQHVLRDKSQSWIDFPLTVAGRFVGKLSCDLEAGQTLSKDAVLEMWNFADEVASHLDSLYRIQFVCQISEVLAEIHDCRTFEELFEYCTTVLPLKVFDARYASFFTVSSDSLGSTKLLLRKTSFPGSKQMENRGYYWLDEPSLTAWVARSRRPLRLQNLGLPYARNDELSRQLESYKSFDERIEWANKIEDSDEHASYLAVPIFSEPNVVAAVLRLTQKRGSVGAFFTERDQVVLKAIACQGIGPKLLALKDAALTHSWRYDHLQEAKLLSIKDSTTATDIVNTFSASMADFFPEELDSRKLYLVNLIDEDGTTFRHHAVGGRLKKDLLDYEGQSHPLSTSLTGRAVRDHSGIVFVNDQSKAADEQSMILIHQDIACALACRVAFRNRVYGAMIVKSDRFDLEKDVHGRLLEMLAAEAGLILARREVSGLRRIAKMLRHKNKVPRWLADRRAEVSEYIHSLLKSFDHGTPDTTHLETQEFHVQDVIEEAIEVAKTQTSCRIRCVSGSAVACANRSIVSTLLYQLIVDRARNARSGGLAVGASVGPCKRQPPGDDRQWLKLFVQGGSNGTCAGEVQALSQSFVESLVSTRGDNSRLFLSRSLAYWHEIQSRKGLLSCMPAHSKGGGRLTLYLPAKGIDHPC